MDSAPIYRHTRAGLRERTESGSSARFACELYVAMLRLRMFISEPHTLHGTLVCCCWNQQRRVSPARPVVRCISRRAVRERSR